MPDFAEALADDSQPRRRGHPPGSRNRTPEERASAAVAPARPRGRPPGSAGQSTASVSAASATSSGATVQAPAPFEKRLYEAADALRRGSDDVSEAVRVVLQGSGYPEECVERAVTGVVGLVGRLPLQRLSRRCLARPHPLPLPRSSLKGAGNELPMTCGTIS